MNHHLMKTMHHIINKVSLFQKYLNILCLKKVIMMEYIPGPKIEEEAGKQLKLLGIKTNRNRKDIGKETQKEVDRVEGKEDQTKEIVEESIQKSDKCSVKGTTKELQTHSAHVYSDWKSKVLSTIGNVLGIHNIFWIMCSIR